MRKLFKILGPLFWGLVIFWVILTLINSEEKNKGPKNEAPQLHQGTNKL